MIPNTSSEGDKSDSSITVIVQWTEDIFTEDTFTI